MKVHKGCRMESEEAAVLAEIAARTRCSESEILRRLIPSQIQLDAAKAYLCCMWESNPSRMSVGALLSALKMTPRQYQQIMLTDEKHPMNDATIAWYRKTGDDAGDDAGEGIILRVFITWAKACAGEDGFYFAKVQNEEGKPIVQNGHPVETILRRVPELK